MDSRRYACGRGLENGLKLLRCEHWIASSMGAKRKRIQAARSKNETSRRVCRVDTRKRCQPLAASQLYLLDGCTTSLPRRPMPASRGFLLSGWAGGRPFQGVLMSLLRVESRMAGGPG